MHRAIHEFRIYGVRSSLPFFQQLLSSEPFLTGDFYTTSLETNPALKPDLALAQPQPDMALIAAVLAEHFAQSSGGAKPASSTATSGAIEPSSGFGEEWKRTARRESLRKG
jgi:pyruvate carboxylase